VGLSEKCKKSVKIDYVFMVLFCLHIITCCLIRKMNNSTFARKFQAMDRPYGKNELSHTWMNDLEEGEIVETVEEKCEVLKRYRDGSVKKKFLVNYWNVNSDLSYEEHIRQSVLRVMSLGRPAPWARPSSEEEREREIRRMTWVMEENDFWV
jgi:hypothetical protein